MGKEAEFLRLLHYLEGWHADSVRARSYDGPGHGSHDAGHAMLLANRYPGPNWRQLWRAACGDGDARDGLLTALRDEVHGLTHSPSQAGPASGLHPGTQEYREAVRTSDGSTRAVGRRFGISHTEVRRIRMSNA